MSIGSLTTVTAPAVSHDLIDLDTAKDELRIDLADSTHDVFLARAITRVSRAINGYCGRVFAPETVSETIFPATGEVMLLLSRYPVMAISSLTLWDGTTLTSGTDFVCDTDRGWLIRTSAGVPVVWDGLQKTVVYTAGYQEIPDDLQAATARMVVAAFHQRGRDPTLRAQSQPGIGDQTYWVGATPGSAGPFPEDVAAILNVYRVPVRA